ncbi:U6 small nuclear RNA (adenine-(43)-N(6))-methyltransferase [Uranotaenia lowii]|uniref:U6 small nuclear RNA (adenine-(43)-N(6))-methyltransferase n=1 Tax=Uranotaenia lowii TaxID=190385 RepID=UPI002478D738|nr:U6 small nuclear RNA (adenine-(43)-N(6))-methyltransferase [Uranotaenia lowii]
MSMNKFMHPRNIYRQKPDYLKLVTKFPELKEFTSVDLNGRLTLDFKNRNALQMLTRCLLKQDFSLEIDLPPDKLVPTLPLRLNYIHWLEDLELAFGWNDRPETRVLDIGCGASCIYALLGVMNSKKRWKMVGLEKATDSVICARENVNRNKLSDWIEVIEQKKEEFSILKGFLSIRPEERFDFCMCNPPFFEDDSCGTINRTDRRPEPSNAFTGVDDELRTEGGELRFIEKIIDESLYLKDKIAVFTTMIGHKKNFVAVLRILKQRQIYNLTSTRFCQGNTTRWGVAWSFSSAAILSKVPDFFEQSSAKGKSLGQPLEALIFSEKDVTSLEDARAKLLIILSQLELDLKPLEQTSSSFIWEVLAHENTWSYQRRKRREAKRKLSPGTENQRNKQLDVIRLSEVLEVSEANSNQNSPQKRRVEPILKAVLCLKLKQTEPKGFYLALSFLSGLAGKDSLNQILQYVKNAKNLFM